MTLEELVGSYGPLELGMREVSSSLDNGSGSNALGYSVKSSSSCEEELELHVVLGV